MIELKCGAFVRMVRIGLFSSSHASTKEKSILDKGIASAKVLKTEHAW